MSGWAERAAAAILPHSNSKTLAAALGEWVYTGRFFDLDATDGTCELCGQEDLRYHFEIENRETAALLLVGSECIKRFDIGGIDEQGMRIDAADTGRLVDKHRRGLVEDARKRRVMTALLKLEQKDRTFEARSFLAFVDDKGAFTPKQVAMLFWRLGSAGIHYRPSDWKVRLRRDSDYSQLRHMNNAALNRVMLALSPLQHRRIEEIRANFARNGQKWHDPL